MDNRVRVNRPEWPPVLKRRKRMDGWMDGWMDKGIIGSGVNVLNGHPYLKGRRGWMDRWING